MTRSQVCKISHKQTLRLVTLINIKVAFEHFELTFLIRKYSNSNSRVANPY